MTKLFVDKAIDINATPSKVWNTLTQRQFTDRWAFEFSSGGPRFHIESEWKLGEPVLWKGDDGKVIVEGKVTSLTPNKLLRFTVFDVRSDRGFHVTKEDGITFRLLQENGRTKLHVRHGDFSVIPEGEKYHRMSAEIWDRVLPTMKELAENGEVSIQKITPFLWFDNEAEEAAKFYTSIFKNSRIGTMIHYGKEGHEIHGRTAGSVMCVEFEIERQKFVALNGGPVFKFNEAISFVVNCETQEEVDYYCEKLSKDGDERAKQCGWLKDKYGVSWQIIPKELPYLVGDRTSEKSQRAMKAMLQMKKIDIKALKKAYEGQ